jgi:GMP synthase-like glutamine amidotransferase
MIQCSEHDPHAMKPIAIFRHASTEGPGYFATVLERHGLSWQLTKIDQGEAVPADPARFAGMVFMGGPMSVNDDLPWIAPVLELIRTGVAANVPVLGHCLGGQLMSRALGGSVSRNPVKEIGWGEVTVFNNPQAMHWFGHAAPSFLSFHWHGETFSVPDGAQRLLGNSHCENQAFALGPHLALQCHIEMTRDMIDHWCVSGAREIARSSGSPGVQTIEAIKTDVEARLAALHRIADRVYERWIENLAR